MKNLFNSEFEKIIKNNLLFEEKITPNLKLFYELLNNSENTNETILDNSKIENDKDFTLNFSVNNDDIDIIDESRLVARTSDFGNMINVIRNFNNPGNILKFTKEDLIKNNFKFVKNFADDIEKINVNLIIIKCNFNDTKNDFLNYMNSYYKCFTKDFLSQNKKLSLSLIEGYNLISNQGYTASTACSLIEKFKEFPYIFVLIKNNFVIDDVCHELMHFVQYATNGREFYLNDKTDEDKKAYKLYDNYSDKYSSYDSIPAKDFKVFYLRKIFKQHDREFIYIINNGEFVPYINSLCRQFEAVNYTNADKIIEIIDFISECFKHLINIRKREYYKKLKGQIFNDSLDIKANEGLKFLQENKIPVKMFSNYYIIKYDLDLILEIINKKFSIMKYVFDDRKYFGTIFSILFCIAINYHVSDLKHAIRNYFSDCNDDENDDFDEKAESRKFFKNL